MKSQFEDIRNATQALVPLTHLPATTIFCVHSSSHPHHITFSLLFPFLYRIFSTTTISSLLCHSLDHAWCSHRRVRAMRSGVSSPRPRVCLRCVPNATRTRRPRRRRTRRQTASRKAATAPPSTPRWRQRGRCAAQHSSTWRRSTMNTYAPAHPHPHTHTHTHTHTSLCLSFTINVTLDVHRDHVVLLVSMMYSGSSFSLVPYMQTLALKRIFPLLLIYFLIFVFILVVYQSIAHIRRVRNTSNTKG